MALIDLNLRPDRPTLRRFGLAAFLILGGLGAWVRWSGGLPAWSFPDAAPTVALAFWAAAALSGLLSLAWPEGNRALWILLTLAGLPIGFVVSWLVLGIIFYGMMTPLNLVFRLIGRDALQRRIDREAKSYWEPHVPPEDVSRYFKQF